MKKHDWFDDPEWEALKRQVYNKKSHGQPPKSPVTTKKPPIRDVPLRVDQSQRRKSAYDTPPEAPRQVNLTIALPNISLRWFKIILQKFNTRRPNQRQLKVAGAALAVIVVLAGGFAVVRAITHKDDGTVAGAVTEVIQKPAYDTLVPKATTEPEAKLRYDPEHQVSSFEDKIRDIPLVVSQQPLPASFKDDPQAELEKVATTIAATKKLGTTYGKAFVGKSAQGPQTTVFVKNKLLIFMQAQSELLPEEIIQYIDNLR